MSFGPKDEQSCIELAQLYFVKVSIEGSFLVLEIFQSCKSFTADKKVKDTSFVETIEMIVDCE